MTTHARPLLAGLLAGAVLLPTAGLAASPSSSAAPSVPAASPAASLVPLELLRWEVISRRPHDTTAWTEGFAFDAEGRLFESTGLNGRSQVRELDPATGEVLRAVPVPDDAYGEGLAIVGDDTLVQLTWKEGQAFTWAKDTLDQTGVFDYAGQGEGWGLCFDGTRLVMSNGSDRLTFRDPQTFAVLGDVAVTAHGEPVTMLNELECVDGKVWANVWQTPYIIRIDPTTGAVDGVMDATGILVPDPAAADPGGSVLNGIAKVPGSDTFLLTGKKWPEMIEVRIPDA
ncbi:MAG: glutaminyl-peptide cyclotransferase [Chloroflexota bacterium]